MNMMGLDEILNELKLLKDLMIQEMFLMNLDRDRTQTLLQGMQSVINSYYNLPVPPNANSAAVPTGVKTPPEFLAPQSINTNARTENVSTPVMLDQEWFLMEQASNQTQLLLFSMQSLINTYNGNETQSFLLNPNFPLVPPAEVPQPKIRNITPTGVTAPSARLLVPQSIIADAPTITTNEISTHESDKQNDLQADFPLIDNDLNDDLERFGDIFNGPDSLLEGVDFHPTPNHLKDDAPREKSAAQFW